MHAPLGGGVDEGVTGSVVDGVTGGVDVEVGGVVWNCVRNRQVSCGSQLVEEPTSRGVGV